MTVSSLEHIARLANETLDHALNSGELPEKTLKEVRGAGFKRVCGFVVRDEEVYASRIEEAMRYRRSNLEDYRRERDHIVAELRNVGITPKAVLPTGTWNRICQRSGLIRLQPDHDGLVRISTDLVARSKMSEVTALALLWGANIFIPVMALLYGLFGPYSESSGLVAGGVIATCVLCWGGTGIAGGISNSSAFYVTLRSLIISGVLRVRMLAQRLRPWKSLLADLFPNGEEPDRFSGGVSCAIVLPQPPPEVARTLHKARHMNIKVAVEPAAIGFAKHPTKTLLEKGLAQIAMEEAFRRQEIERRRDPIPYVEIGGAVAILDQFGSFKIEERVVQEVMTTDFVP